MTYGKLTDNRAALLKQGTLLIIRTKQLTTKRVIASLLSAD